MLRWLAAGGAFLASLDSTVNIAFPAMAAAFGVAPDRLRWVIIGYVLTYSILSFVGGALGDRVGHGRMFRVGIVLCVASYLLCGTAPTFGVLVGGRVVQGLGTGLIYGTAPALVTLGIEAQARGRALGFLSAAMGVAFSVGPIMAGVLVERFGWPAVFHLRLPLALALLAWAGARAPEARRPRSGSMVGLRDVRRASVMGLGAVAFLANAGIFAIWLLAPFYLVERRGFGPAIGGVLFMLTPLGTALAAPLAGRLVDRVGARGPMGAGLALEAVGLLLLSRAEPATSPVVLVVTLFAAGFGLGVFQVPNMTAVMARFGGGHQGAAGGFAFLARTLGTVAGVAVFGQIVAVRAPMVGFDGASSSAFSVAAGLVAAGACAILATPQPRHRS